MKIILLSSAKLAEKWQEQALKLYMNRLRHYCRFELLDLSLSAKGGRDQVLQREAKAYSNVIKSEDLLCLLDERGAQQSSVEFAGFLDKKMLYAGRGNIIFAIGGPYGFADELRSRADVLLSMSKMTFTHDMAKIFFVEQLYRAFTIRAGEPYHHE